MLPWRICGIREGFGILVRILVALGRQALRNNCIVVVGGEVVSLLVKSSPRPHVPGTEVRFPLEKWTRILDSVDR